MVKIGGGPSTHITCPKLQPDQLVNQVNPVSGQKYVALDTTPYVRLISVCAYVIFSVQPQLLEVHVTIDDQVGKFSVVDPAQNTGYYAVLDSKQPFSALPLETTDHSKGRAYLLDGRSVKVEAEVTGGTVTRLLCIVRWARWT